MLVTHQGDGERMQGELGRGDGGAEYRQEQVATWEVHQELVVSEGICPKQGVLEMRRHVLERCCPSSRVQETRPKVEITESLDVQSVGNEMQSRTMEAQDKASHVYMSCIMVIQKRALKLIWRADPHTSSTAVFMDTATRPHTDLFQIQLYYVHQGFAAWRSEWVINITVVACTCIALEMSMLFTCNLPVNQKRHIPLRPNAMGCTLSRNQITNSWNLNSNFNSTPPSIWIWNQNSKVLTLNFYLQFISLSTFIC